MRIDDERLFDVIAGSTHGGQIECQVWYDGEPAALGPDGVDDPTLLDVSALSISWDAERQEQGQLTMTLLDPDGVLAPWSPGDPLAPYGSRLHLSWVIRGNHRGPIVVPLGIWRVRSVDPDERWRLWGDRLVPAGGVVSVRADEDPMASAKLERIDAEVVEDEATCLSEVERLLEMIDQTADLELAPDDRAISPQHIIERDRMDAIEDLLDPVNAAYRAGVDGSLQIIPREGVESGWTIAGGEDGVLISLARTLSDEGVYNAVIAEGQDEEGVPLKGIAVNADAGDPLRWGGPFGQVPLFHNSIADTDAGMQASAETLLDTRSSTGEAVLSVECLANPALQVHDIVTVVAPSIVGGQSLTGRVMSMTISASDGLASKRMSLAVAVSLTALAAVADNVRRSNR